MAGAKVVHDMRVPLWAAAVVLVCAVMVASWPFPLTLSAGVSDLGDPLLNAWTLSWVAHTLPAHPGSVFDANIFHPATDTLAYSEPMLVPGLIMAPLSWMGGDPILVHNLLVLVAYAGSGLTMFLLVRRLTAHDGAALVAGVLFAVYPYRTEMFAKVQMEVTMWWPLALWCLHRVAADAGATPMRWWSMALAVSLAAQVYSGVYLAAYGVPAFAVVVAGCVIRAPRDRRMAVALTCLVAGVLALIMSLPLAQAFGRASADVGTRELAETRVYSAEWRDYLRPHPEQWLWGRAEHPGPAERRLFPGWLGLSLGTIGALSGGPVGVTYAVATLSSVELSRGTGSVPFVWLFDHVESARAFRVPARFGMLAGMTLCVLAGLGVSAVLRRRSRGVTIATVSVLLGLAVLEGRVRPPELSSPGDRDPAVYQWLARQPEGVVCEFPVGPLQGRVGPQDPTYMYYSTRHWKPLVNGYSGFSPPSYQQLLGDLAGFPDAASLHALRDAGVRYLLVHERFYIRDQFEEHVARLRADRALRWAGHFAWTDGTRTEVFVLGG